MVICLIFKRTLQSVSKENPKSWKIKQLKLSNFGAQYSVIHKAVAIQTWSHLPHFSVPWLKVRKPSFWLTFVSLTLKSLCEGGSLPCPLQKHEQPQASKMQILAGSPERSQRWGGTWLFLTRAAHGSSGVRTVPARLARAMINVYKLFSQMSSPPSLEAVGVMLPKRNE